MRSRGEELKLMNRICKSIALIIVVGNFMANDVSAKPCNESLLKYSDLENQAIKKVEAAYPAEPGLRVKGRVAIRIVVDKHGSVVSARLVCGHPLLAASSVAAAIQWKFRPKRVNGKATKNVSIIIFELPTRLDQNGERQLISLRAHNNS
jgi:TonB family protein